MESLVVTKNTKLKDILKSPAGHDIINKALYAAGIDSSVITKTPLGSLTLASLQKVSMGKIDDEIIDSLLGILNSEKDAPLEDDAPIEKKWWKEAVFYQIYPRSFNDSNGDGIGDLNGIIEKLDYLKELGVDAIWCSPIYDSPNDDNGYDIRDYDKIMEEFGTMEDFDRLLSEIHKRDMKLIMDLVINHSSDEHKWFQSSLHDPDSPYRDYYIWRDGRKDNQPPNNWDSIFSGSAWNYYPERGQWAMHLFSSKQMDFNWENENLRKDLYAMINRWLDKGVDGFRLDVISFISKTPGLPDGNDLVGSLMVFKGCEHYFYGPRLHEYLREMNEKIRNYFESLERNEKFSHGAGYAYRAYLDTCNNSNSEELIVNDLPFEDDMSDFVETLRSAGLTTVLITDASTALLRNLHQLDELGCRFDGLCKATRNYAWGAPEEIPAIRIRLN